MSDWETVPTASDWSTNPEPPAVTWPRRGVSHYLALGEPTLDPFAFADKLASLNANFTRIWLCDAWGIRGDGETGTYDGFCPVERAEDGRWDLFKWSGAYFDRLRTMAVALNSRGIVPQFTFLELYTWAARKSGMMWVPDQHVGPWRDNVNSVRWGDPDDPTFFSLPDDWQKEFMRRVVETLDGTAWVAELANEMPEKAMHERMADHLRSVGYHGEITVNRNEDTPGQYANMKIGPHGRYERIAFHGKGHISYLDEFYTREPVYKTFRDFYDSSACEPARVIWSGDGVGTNNCEIVPNVYDKDAIRAVVRDAARRGQTIEMQERLWKLGRFCQNRFDLNDCDEDFMRELMNIAAAEHEERTI